MQALVSKTRFKVPSFALPSLWSGGSARSRRWPVVLAGLVWAAVGLSAVYWGLWALGRTQVTPLGVPQATLPVVAVEQVSRSLGWTPVPEAEAAPAVDPASRFKLLGIASQLRLRGAALIAVDGKPPQPFTIGSALEEGLVLQSVDSTGARLGPEVQGDTTFELKMPEANEQ